MVHTSTHSLRYAMLRGWIEEGSGASAEEGQFDCTGLPAPARITCSEIVQSHQNTGQTC